MRTQATEFAQSDGTIWLRFVEGFIAIFNSTGV